MIHPAIARARMSGHVEVPEIITLSTGYELADGENPWKPYKGKRGGTGAQHSQTGQIVYGKRAQQLLAGGGGKKAAARPAAKKPAAPKKAATPKKSAAPKKTPGKKGPGKKGPGKKGPGKKVAKRPDLSDLLDPLGIDPTSSTPQLLDEINQEEREQQSRKEAERLSRPQAQEPAARKQPTATRVDHHRRLQMELLRGKIENALIKDIYKTSDNEYREYESLTSDTNGQDIAWELGNRNRSGGGFSIAHIVAGLKAARRVPPGPEYARARMSAAMNAANEAKQKSIREHVGPLLDRLHEYAKEAREEGDKISPFIQHILDSNRWWYGK